LLLFMKDDLSEIEGCLFYLVDDQGRVISSNNDSSIFSEEWLDKETINIGTEKYLSAKRTIDRTNWNLLMLIPFSRITGGVSNLKSILIFAGLLGTILFLILSMFLSSLITRPVRKMMLAMKHDDDGLLKPNPETYFNREINELNKNYNEMVEKNNHLIKVVYEKELSKTKAEMEAIQAQINPHFLYNTLEAFYWTLVEREEYELSNYIISLSDLFRYSIKSERDDDLVFLEKELNHVKRYLEIMKFRLGDRLNWDVKYNENEIAKVVIPRLTIQPLVENAIKHGIEKKIGRGNIKITVNRFHKDFMKIVVEDNGKGIGKEKLIEIRGNIKKKDFFKSAKKCIGLNNIYKRLQANFGESVQFNIYSKENEGTRVRLIIPERSEE
ncbi:MAG: sensor histidine kinase, partial [Halanaerobiaceae bacterium]